MPNFDTAKAAVTQLAVRYEILTSPTARTASALLHPDRSSNVTVEWSASNRVGRFLTGVRLDPLEAAKLTPGRSWIRVMVNDRSIGVFLYQGGVEDHLPSGVFVSADSCPDRSQQLDVELLDPVDIADGELLTDFLVELYGLAGFTEGELDIEESDITAGALLAFAPGGSTLLEIAVQVHRLLGYLPPHLNRAGRPQARSVPTPQLLPPSLQFAAGQASKVVAGSVRIGTSLLNSPNIYTVRSTSPAGAAVWARHAIPADSPNSVENLGYYRPATLDLPGLADNEQALEVAKAQARIDARVVRTVEFSSTPSPDHDAFEIVSWEGERMLEHAWTLPLGGGAMRHTLKTAYADG